MVPYFVGVENFNQRRMKLLDSNKIIGELQVLAQELGDKDSELVSKAVDLIEYLVENQVSPPVDLDLRLYMSQLITILGNVSMSLAAGTRPASPPWGQPSQMPYPSPYNPPTGCQVERRSQPRGNYEPPH